jgi:predicted RNA-binding protein with PIN domain
MSFQRLIIDGYSLIHRDPETKRIVSENLRRAREVLIEKISRTATAMADHVTIVFDGQQQSGSSPGGTQAIELVYSSSGQTADTVIERLVHQASNPGSWLVVTNDRRERETVMATGVQTMSCAVFLEECARMQKHQTQHMKRRSLKQPGPKLGDYFPK